MEDGFGAAQYVCVTAIGELAHSAASAFAVFAQSLCARLAPERAPAAECPGAEAARSRVLYNPAGAERAAIHGGNWQSVSAKDTIRRIAGDNPVVEYTTSGKTIYRNPQTGLQVVYDNAGKYFRVENSAGSGTAQFVDQFGKPIPDNVPLAKPDSVTQTGVPKNVRNALTHFLDAD